MAIPVANFKPTIYGFKVVFTDTSTHSPTSWSWNVDGVEFSTSQNPEKIFSDEGSYEVSLIATNADGSNTITKTIVVNEFPSTGITIEQSLQQRLPSVVLEDPQYEDQIDGLIKKYQLIFQNSTSKTIDDAHVFLEESWPPLVNLLISCLVVIDLVQINATKMLLNNFAGDSSEDGSGGSAIKKITTGPSEVEFQNAGQYFQAVYSKRNSDGSSMWDELRAEACLLAGRVGIYLPFCKQVKVGATNLKITTHIP